MHKPVPNLLLATAVAALFTPAAEAAYLSPDGLGQALIYPYYTAQSASGNAFTTYVSVINHSTEAKVVRVRFREARNARVAQAFNLFLGANDVWTGAVIPLAAPAGATRVISADASCVSGPFDTLEPGPPGRTFQNFFYAGANSDGFGEGLDRAREGWIEMIEMAALTGAAAAAVSHAGGAPVNCGLVQGDPALELSPPTGQLSGTLTLINVASGLDFTVNAEALAELSTQAFYRPPADPYPGFDAAEITPVSMVVANGQAYRSVWPRGVDAVSATLMREQAMGEYVLDAGTRSKTEFVVTFPTRQFYATAAGVASPFTAFTFYGDLFDVLEFDRGQRGSVLFTSCSGIPIQLCQAYWAGSVSAATFSNASPHTQAEEGIFGSRARPLFKFFGFPEHRPAALTGIFENGWLALPFNNHAQAMMTSLAGSTRIDLATGQVTTGAHIHRGMPVVGFTARTFENGTLACGAERCQGNYGGAFPMKYRRSITAP